MKILSLWQPWASFMALGYKANETRSWPTSYRGPLAIHAAKNTSALEDADDILQDAGLLKDDQTTEGATKWPLGEIVAVVDLVDCKRTEDVLGGLSQCERAMGNYSPCRFAWVTTNLRRIKPGIPFRGMQGLKPLPEEAHGLILERFLRMAAART
jgi:hypothetical protein